MFGKGKDIIKDKVKKWQSQAKIENNDSKSVYISMNERKESCTSKDTSHTVTETQVPSLEVPEGTIIIPKENRFASFLQEIKDTNLSVPCRKNHYYLARSKSMNEVLDFQSKTGCAVGSTVENQQRTSLISIPNNYFSQKHVCGNRSIVHVRRLNTRLLDTIEHHNIKEMESLLQSGANPNATCRLRHVSECHAAAYADGDALRVLLKHNPDKHRKDIFGRTPLHFATWGGRIRNIILLLDLPIGLQNEVELLMESDHKIKIKPPTLQPLLSSTIDIPIYEHSEKGGLLKNWTDNIEHDCKSYIPFPMFLPGWTPLHIASAAAHPKVTWLLLAAGANPNSKDAMGHTPLDVAGSACYFDSHKIDLDNYVKTIKTLIEFGGELNKATASTSGSALHVAVELCSVKAIRLLLAAGAPVTHRNAQGNTPLHECVSKLYLEPLRILAKHSWPGQTTPSVDVRDSSGCTVLQKSILASWIPGVCEALDAGADVLLQDGDGNTAIHLAARKGNVEILDEILNAAQNINDINYENEHVEAPLLCAIRSGNLDCVEAIINAGASLEIINYNYEARYEYTKTGLSTLPNFSIKQNELWNINKILHATAEIGHVDTLKHLLKHDKSLEKLLNYKCPYLRNMMPVECAAFHNRFCNFKFLLEKTRQRSEKIGQTFDPSVLLFIAAKYNRENMFSEVIKLFPKGLHNPPGIGCYPLHAAIRQSNIKMILLLLDNGADLSEYDETGNTGVSLIIKHIPMSTQFILSIFDRYINTNIPILNRYCEVTIDYRVLIPGDPARDDLLQGGQMRVVTTLLRNGSRQNQRKLLVHPLVESFLHLKWKTFRAHYYMMIFLHSLFVLSLSAYLVSIFYFRDKKIPMHPLWNLNMFRCVSCLSLLVIISQEFSTTYLTWENCLSINMFSEFCIRCAAYGLSIVTSVLVTYESPDEDWRRFLAVQALTMAWLNTVSLYSKTGVVAFRKQMFWKVLPNMLENIVMFSAVITAFSLCFMILFRCKEPFDDPASSLIKTVVMMMAEFDYSSTYSRENAAHLSLSTSIAAIRLVFVIFMAIVTIVFMNLMIGVAVNDVQKLIEEGNMRSLDDLVAYLEKFEISRGRSILHTMELTHWLRYKSVPRTVTIKTGQYEPCCYSKRIKKAILNKAQEHIEKLYKRPESIENESKLEYILNKIDELNSKVSQIKKSQHE